MMFECLFLLFTAVCCSRKGHTVYASVHSVHVYKYMVHFRNLHILYIATVKIPIALCLCRGYSQAILLHGVVVSSD